ncbi:MAG TPA: hypothetical protein VIV60_36735, partial [Polyangiaceae bacterium]
MQRLTRQTSRPTSRPWQRDAARWLGLGIAMCLGCCSGKDVLVGFNQKDARAGSAGSSMTAAGAKNNGAFGGVSIPSTFVGSAAFGGDSVAGATSSSLVDQCADGGPDITLPTLGSCTNDLARRIFLFAICSCTDFDAQAGVDTETFGVPTTGLDVGASIGVNGSYTTDDQPSYVRGSLWVAADAEFGNHDILGDLQCGE